MAVIRCSEGGVYGYTEVLMQIDITDLSTSMYNNLAVFTSILIARHCFSLESFCETVALPSLVDSCDLLLQGKTLTKIELF